MHPSAKLPPILKWQDSSGSAGGFQVVTADGRVLASSISSRAAAAIFAATPDLLRGYDWLFDEANELFHLKLGLEYSDPDIDDFAEDEGELEERFPGAPAYARTLKELSERLERLRMPDGTSPVEEYVEPLQLD